MKNEVILYGALGIAAVILLTKGKAGNYVGQSAGAAAGGAVAGATEGAIQSILIDPYKWSQQQEYIPIIDETAKGLLWFKKLGNDNSWFY